MGGLAPSAGLLEKTPGAALRTTLLRSRDVRGAPHPASYWCALGAQVPALLTPQWYPHGLLSTSSWPSLVAPQWHPHGLWSTSSWPTPRCAVNFFVAEFGGTAVVSRRFAVNFFVAAFGGIAVQWYPQRFFGQFLSGRVWWHRSGIPTFLQSTSSWPSLVAPQWYPQIFAVNVFVAEFGGTAVVSPRLCCQLPRGRVWWHHSGIRTLVWSTSSWPSLVAPQWYPYGFAVNFLVPEFGGTTVVPQRFFGQFLCGRVSWQCICIPTFVWSISSWPSLGV